MQSVFAVSAWFVVIGALRCASDSESSGTDATPARDAAMEAQEDATTSPRDSSPMSDASSSSDSDISTPDGADATSGETNILSGPGYEAWLALDCDCTAANPCPMSCDGIVGIEIPSISVPGTTTTVDPIPMCDVEIREDAPCPEGTGSSCGSVYVANRVGYGIVRRELRWFDSLTYEQTGWELRWSSSSGNYGGRICGGVVPDAECLAAEVGQTCYSDQQPQFCRCPPPPCDGPCPNNYPCETDDDCLSRFCELVSCQPADHCSDGVLSGVEADVDCGGQACAACEAGKSCNVGTDCQSGSCESGECSELPP
jgi:hypothetical protein